jgi:hypothetical protein
MRTCVGILRLSGALALTAWLACDADNRDPSDLGPRPDVPADTAPDVATDDGAGHDVDAVTGATKLILDDTHPGWQKAACWDCHTADDHNDGKDPYLCTGCHGTNGAPAGHGGASPCAGCHDPLPHGVEGFPDPLSCRTCHGT